MKTMLLYELKKMFNFKKTLICFISVIALCAVIFLGLAFSHNLFEYLPELKQSLNASSGEMTPERMDSVYKRYEEIINNHDYYIEVDGEQAFIPPDEIKREMDGLNSVLSMRNVNEWAQNIIDDLQKELTDSDISPNRELLIKHNIEMLSQKGNLTLGYNLFYDFYNSFVKNFAPFLLGFFILFFIAPVFSNEYNTKMDGLILASKRGKRGVIIAKFAAALIGITAICILVIGTYISICGAVLGFSGSATSLTTMYYDVYQYLESPYDFTMLQFLFISIGVSWAACIGFGFFTLFVSSKIRSTITVFAINLVVFYLPLLFYAMTNGREELSGIINFSYGRIMQAAPLIDRFEGFVMFGNVVMLKEVLLFSLGTVTVVFGFLTYHSFRQRQSIN